MDWHDRIVFDPETLYGNPCIKGTEIGVEYIFGLLTSGWTEAEVLEYYPLLESEDVQAVFAFVVDCLRKH